MECIIEIAGPQHEMHAEAICQLIAESAKARGTGIAERQPSYIRTKMNNGNAVIALHGDTLAGFCYIEVWSHGRYVANSGLIVAPEFRQQGLAKTIKQKAFELSREKFPEARLFGITTSLPVMRINSELGYKPVTFSELTQDEAFWEGCRSCPNFDILERSQRRMCLCTAMLAPSAREAMQFDLTHLVVNNIW
ncbi:MAG: GNAT family N-acetyltransferase [Lewinellaceae bacterium]|nr:GNAT family N-acetyltransferase [Phaeodactylibacter sp.]MCB9346655.1 GNAT family N-acetyltransferase [Lewinellaceae bacterium]